MTLAVQLFILIPSSPSPNTRSTSTNTNNARVTILEASNAPMIITELDNVATVTPTSTPRPSPICPAWDGSTYIATNRPQPTIDPNLHIPKATLSFKVLCYSNFVSQITDMQIYTNVFSLREYLNRCALFNFNAAAKTWPGVGCTGIALGTGACWLKSNVSLDSPNGTATYPGYEGAVLLGL